MADLSLWPIGNCQVSALVDRAAGFVWACAPRVDGDPLFCSLLEPKGESALPRGEGLLVEEKPAGVALHYRLAPERAEEVNAFLEALAARSGLALQRGKMVAELRPEGSDKGAALRRLMGEPPFAGARPVFVGDDLTDEDAFRAAASLGGEGVLVGPARPSAARWRLDGVADVNSWLESAAYG